MAFTNWSFIFYQCYFIASDFFYAVKTETTTAVSNYFSTLHYKTNFPFTSTKVIILHATLLLEIPISP